MTQEIPHHRADGFRDVLGFGFARGDALRIQLAQAPAGLGRLGQPLHQVGQLGRAVEEVEGFLQLLRRRQAAVEVVVDRDDRRAAGRVHLPLLLGGAKQELERGRIHPPRHLLGAEDQRQRDAQRLGPLEINPLIYAHLICVMFHVLCVM